MLGYATTPSVRDRPKLKINTNFTLFFHLFFRFFRCILFCFCDSFLSPLALLFILSLFLSHDFDDNRSKAALMIHNNVCQRSMFLSPLLAMCTSVAACHLSARAHRLGHNWLKYLLSPNACSNQLLRRFIQCMQVTIFTSIH